MYATQAGFVPTPQLPVNPLQVTVPWLAISAQNPPYVPPVRPVDPNLQSQVPLISAIAAFEVQRAAQEKQNPLRIFMFNMMAQNNFGNQEFESFVAAVMDLLWFTMRTGGYQGFTVEQASLDAVTKMMEMARGMYLLRFPMLEQYLSYDLGLLQASRELAQAFQQTAAQIQAAKQSMGYAAGGMGAGGYAQPGMPAAGFYGGGPQVVPQQGFQRNFGVAGGGSNWSHQLATATTQLQTGSSTGLFAGGGGARAGSAAAAPSGANINSDRYAAAAALRQPTFAPQPEPTSEAQIVETLPTAEQQQQLPRLEEVRWVPSETYPHPPAYNPELYVVLVEPQADGSWAPRIMKKEEVMDYERHAVGTIFGTRPKHLDLSKTADTLERIQHGVQQINDQTPPPAEEGSEPPELPFTQLIRPEVDEKGHDQQLRDVSPHAVWLITSMERLTKQVEGAVPDIYRVHAQLYDAVVGTSNETPFVRSMGSCDSFIELREKLNYSVDKLSAELWAVINRRMTHALNRAVKENLSIPGLRIDSFAEDVEDLLKVIENRYGELVLGALTKNQGAIIRRTLGTFSDEDAEAESAGWLPEHLPEGVEAPKVTFVKSNVSFTYLNCRSHELNVQLQPKVGSAVTPRGTPLLYQLLEGIFTAPSTLQYETQHGEFDTHLIRTVDGRVLEAQRGFIGEEYFVLTLVE